MVTVALLNVSLTILTLIGAFLNCYILLVVLLSKQAQTANHILLVHLGIVDVLLCAMFLIFSAPNLWRDSNWAPCNIHGFLFTLLHPIALWTVCGLNCDRYYAISSPLHYAALVNPRKVAVGLCIAWILALAFCLPPLFCIAPYYFRAELGACMPHFSLGEGLSFWYSTAYTAFTLILPTALILGCNLKVLMIARNHRHRIASAIFEVAISAQVTITHQRNPFFPPQIGAGTKFKGKSAVSTVLQLIGSFMILYYPFYGIVIWESTTNTVNNLYLAKSSSQKREIEVYPTLVTIASTLLTCSPTVNGLLYGIKNKILRKSFQNYIRKKMTKCELNQEIQARTPSACGSRRPSLTPLGVLNRPPNNQPSFTSVASQLVANNSSFLQRRLSEICLNSVNNNNNKSVTIHNNQLAYPNKSLSKKSKIPRIASTEITWSPVTSSGDAISSLDVGSSGNGEQYVRGKLKKLKTYSCNSLQIPSNTFQSENGVMPVSSAGSPESKPSRNSNGGSGGGLLLQRIIGVKLHLGHDLRSELNKKSELKRKSPRILITRTMSEESDQPEPNAFGSNENNFSNRKYSLSTSFLEDKASRREIQKVSSDEEDIEHLRIQEDFDDEDCESDQTRRIEMELSGSSPDYESLSMTGEGGEKNHDQEPSESHKLIGAPSAPSFSLRSSSQDSALSRQRERYNHPDSKLVLQSWPCTKRQYHHIDDSTIFDESDESSENESKNSEFKTRVLRNSCSFMEFSK